MKRYYITDDMPEQLGLYFIETVATWTDEKEKEAYKFASLYLEDFSYSLFPDMPEDERKELVDAAEKYVAES